jgi:hypothetical protein
VADEDVPKGLPGDASLSEELLDGPSLPPTSSVGAEHVVGVPSLRWADAREASGPNMLSAVPIIFRAGDGSDAGRS